METSAIDGLMVNSLKLLPKIQLIFIINFEIYQLLLNKSLDSNQSKLK